MECLQWKSGKILVNSGNSEINSLGLFKNTQRRRAAIATTVATRKKTATPGMGAAMIGIIMMETTTKRTKIATCTLVSPKKKVDDSSVGPDVGSSAIFSY